MGVKILHAADLHMDSPFDGGGAEQAILRRREQRGLLQKITELAKREGARLILLSGDLLDSASSYYETGEALVSAFAQTDAQVFIAPGNHDYYCEKSPYAQLKFPPNVHIFRTREIECVTIDALGCRVWGMGFDAPHLHPALTGFNIPDNGYTDIMVMHGDTGGGDYNAVTESDIASSGLSYLALGHIHAFSGILRAGNTFYAYPGCPEGRGFDETGKKGVIVGNVDKTGCELRFVPLGGREYRVIETDLTGETDALYAVRAKTAGIPDGDICRIVLTGEFDGRADVVSIEKQLRERFFSVTVLDRTRPVRDIWRSAGEETLRGVFLREMKSRYDSGDEEAKRGVILAVRYALAALENGEEWQV
jgi:DNA repair exonuclease SbcCD nuclease subunit